MLVFQEEPLSREEGIPLPSLELRPNPTDEWVALRVPDHQIVSWQIYDLRGILIAEEFGLYQEEVRVNGQHLAEGCYLVQVKEARGKVLTAKLMILR